MSSRCFPSANHLLWHHWLGCQPKVQQAEKKKKKKVKEMWKCGKVWKVNKVKDFMRTIDLYCTMFWGCYFQTVRDTSVVSVQTPAPVLCGMWEPWLGSQTRQTQLWTGLGVCFQNTYADFVGVYVCACLSFCICVCEFVRVCREQAERGVTPITADKPRPNTLNCPNHPQKTETGCNQPAILHSSRLSSIKMCGSQIVS